MMNLRSIYNKPTNYKILERWIVRDTQPNPGDRIKRLGTIGELRRIPINADNLKNKDKLKEEDHANQPKVATFLVYLNI